MVHRDPVHYELSVDNAEKLPMGFFQTMAEMEVSRACKWQMRAMAPSKGVHRVDLQPIEVERLGLIGEWDFM